MGGSATIFLSLLNRLRTYKMPHQSIAFQVGVCPRFAQFSVIDTYLLRGAGYSLKS